MKSTPYGPFTAILFSQVPGPDGPFPPGDWLTTVFVPEEELPPDVGLLPEGEFPPGVELFPEGELPPDVGLLFGETELSAVGLLLFAFVSPGFVTVEFPGPVAAGPVALPSGSASVVLSEPGFEELEGLVEEPGPLPGPTLPGP